MSLQIHEVDENGQALLQRKLGPTRIGIEARGAAHHWERVLHRLEHEVAKAANAAGISERQRYRWPARYRGGSAPPLVDIASALNGRRNQALAAAADERPTNRAATAHAGHHGPCDSAPPKNSSVFELGVGQIFDRSWAHRHGNGGPARASWTN